MKKIVLTGGGSAGHVTPHLALLPHLLKEGYEVHYIGTQDGIEHGMVGNLPGVTYHVVKSGKLRRYFDWKNFTDPFRVIAGAFQSAHLMRRLKPDVCFSKGGFVSVPVVVGAWLHGVPVLCHESDLTPGLANKICARFAKKAGSADDGRQPGRAKRKRRPARGAAQASAAHAGAPPVRQGQSG